MSLSKQISLEAGSYFADVLDTYTFTGAQTLQIAAGIKLHSGQDTVENAEMTAQSYAIWEKASDQSAEPEDGLIGVAVILPGAQDVFESGELDHALLVRTISSGETFSYRFGSCWSKGDIKTPADWFTLVQKQ